MGLKLEHVSYLYGTDTELLVRALDDVNLEIPDGQFIGLIGHTGSGKSTLVQHLNGLLKPSEGTILFNGENIWAQDYSRKTLRSKVGLVFQYPEHQLFETDVFADVCYGPKNLGLEQGEIERRAKKALELVGFPAEPGGNPAGGDGGRSPGIDFSFLYGADDHDRADGNHAWAGGAAFTAFEGRSSDGRNRDDSGCCDAVYSGAGRGSGDNPDGADCTRGSV